MHVRCARHHDACRQRHSSHNDDHHCSGGLRRFYENVEAFAKECGEARIWFGVHFRNTINDSQHMGKQIARWVMRKYLLPLRRNGFGH